VRAGGLGRHGRAAAFALGVLCAGLLVGLGPETVRAPGGAAGTPAQRECVTSALRDLPADVDLVIGVSDASKLRGSLLGQRAERALRQQGATERIEPAWKALAQELGWNQEQLFDRLLGSRAMLVVRFERDAKGEISGTQWALCSRISRETESSLRERLKAAPRGVLDGRQVLSLERGNYELATRPTGVAVAGGKPAEAEVVIAPTGEGGGTLFEQLVTRKRADVGAGNTAQPDAKASAAPAGAVEAGAACLGELLGERSALAGGASPARRGGDSMPDQPADVVLLWRLRANAGSGAVAPGAARIAMLYGRATNDRGSAWDVRLFVRGREGGAGAMADARPIDDRSFERLASGSVLGVYQGTSAERLPTPELPIPDLLRQLRLGPEYEELLTNRQAMRIDVLDAEDPVRRRLSIAAAVGVSDVRKLAPELDRRLAEFVAGMERTRQETLVERASREGAPGASGSSATLVQLSGVQAGRSGPPDFEGLSPAAVRVMPLDFASPRPDVLLMGGELTLAWSCPGDEQTAAEEDGWCCVGLAPGAVAPAGEDRGGGAPAPRGSAAQTVRALAAGLSQGAPAAGDGSIWRLSAKPRLMESALPSLLPDSRGIRSMLRELEAVEARLGVTPEGDVVGRATVELVDRP